MTPDQFKGKLLANFASKKFQTMVGSVLLSVSVGIAGGADWRQIQLTVAAIVAIYLGVQGVADIAKRSRK